jgi:ribosomal protein S18 acetylase RimI-like enzyme
VEALQRALRFTWEVAEVVADDADRIPEGTVLRTPSAPSFWAVNCVRLEGPQPDLRLDDAEALAAAYLPGLPYRQLHVEDEATGARLADAADDAGGWRVERALVMALRSGPDRPPGAPPVREGRLEEILDLLDAWNAEEHPDQPAEALADVTSGSRRGFERLPWRHFVATDADDRAVAMCSVLARDGVAQVEDVYALPEVRGLGLGRAVTATAVEHARAGGHELVFLLADDEGWPKWLYAKLGFAPIGRRAALHRDVPG